MYTPEITKELIDKYLEAEDKDAIIDELAELFNKPARSIIGKLSKEKVYIKKMYKTKAGKNPITKVEMIHDLSNLLNGDADKLQGLIKTPKPDLTYLINLVKKNIY